MHDIYLKGCCSPYGTHSALSRSSVVTISGYAKLSDDPLISRYLNGIVWTFSHAEMKSCSFSITSQFNFKNGHFFFKPSNGQNGNFNNHKQLITQMIFMASCIEEIYSFKSIGQAGILNLCQADFWAFSGYQLIVVCFGSPKVLRRQMLDIKCKQKLLDIRN